MVKEEIIGKLPYTHPFLFVDEILHIDEESISATYTYNEELEFYKGHFKGNPVTPGVILIETMAQIGLACLGIYLLQNDFSHNTKIAMTSAETEFLKPVFPGEKVIVNAQKSYFRFGKLKCAVQMINQNEEIVCNGVIAGIIAK